MQNTHAIVCLNRASYGSYIGNGQLTSVSATAAMETETMLVITRRIYNLMRLNSCRYPCSSHLYHAYVPKLRPIYSA